MIDAKRYNRFESRGLTNIVIEDGEPYLTFKRFSVEDGSELPPEKQLIQVEEIKKRIESLLDEVDGMKKVLEEVEKMK